ncbi:MAG: winged helix-turn-helix transcriptional regulator [Nitrospina sp.]|nr:winged helix-turn-helix transcriptional regulator [Nitrospina sp.]
MENLVKILKSLGELNRLRIVMTIGEGSLSVTEIIHATGLPQTLVSFHLRTLRNSEIVKTERNGPFIYYSLFSPSLIQVLKDLSQINNSIEASVGEPNDSFSNRKLKTS